MKTAARHTMITMLAASLFTSACADESAEFAAGADFGNAPQELYGAQDHLFNHRVSEARDEYQRLRTSNPSNGTAAAGLAITDVLLLPYHTSVNRLVRDHLGGSNGLDAKRDVIYGESGYLYLLSRGVPWDDSETGELKGIKTLLASDLPWARSKLESSEAFVVDLNKPVDLLMDGLVAVAEAVEPIETNIDVALADPEFTEIFIPGQVFHDDALSLTLGKAELSLLKSVLAGGRSVIYFVSAYEHRWTLEKAFGEDWQRVAGDPMDPEHVPEYDANDYTYSYLDAQWFRAIKSPQRLERSGAALGSALEGLIEMLDFGIVTETDTALSWRAVDERFVADLRALLVSARDATRAMTELAGSTPSTSADFSVLFNPGRELDPRTPWLQRTVVDDGFETFTEWNTNDAAVESFFVDGVFEPGFNLDEPPALRIDSGSDAFGETLTTEVSQNFEDAYFSTR